MKNILNDTVYLGIVTQNRTGTRSYKDKAHDTEAGNGMDLP